MPPKKANSCPATPASHQLHESATDLVDLLKNLRGAALLAALAEVYATKVTNTDGKHIEIENNFFGAPERDTASLLQLMLGGEGPFSVLFDQVQTPPVKICTFANISGTTPQFISSINNNNGIRK
jgi:hypothetical protein